MVGFIFFFLLPLRCGGECGGRRGATARRKAHWFLLGVTAAQQMAAQAPITDPNKSSRARWTTCIPFGSFSGQLSFLLILLWLPCFRRFVDFLKGAQTSFTTGLRGWEPFVVCSVPTYNCNSFLTTRQTFVCHCKPVAESCNEGNQQQQPPPLSPTDHALGRNLTRFGNYALLTAHLVKFIIIIFL